VNQKRTGGGLISKEKGIPPGGRPGFSWKRGPIWGANGSEPGPEKGKKKLLFDNGNEYNDLRGAEEVLETVSGKIAKRLTLELEDKRRRTSL